MMFRIVESKGKRFNLELKKSSSGRFVKVTEVSQEGQEYRIFLAMSSVTEFIGGVTLARLEGSDDDESGMGT